MEPAIRPWKQPRRFDAPRADPPPTFSPQHAAARVAIHEACHAVADFMRGSRIWSIEVGDYEGVVHSQKHDNTFDECVALLAPHALEDMFGWERSGDPRDEAEVDRILRANVSSLEAIPQARAVLEEAAGQLVTSGMFDTLRRALSPHLKPGTRLNGDEVESILFEALERHQELYGGRGTERHSRSAPAIAPWYIVSGGGRELYRGSDEQAARRVQAAHPRSTLVGSLWGGDEIGV